MKSKAARRLHWSPPSARERSLDRRWRELKSRIAHLPVRDQLEAEWEFYCQLKQRRARRG